jgi:hypothetical protein
VRVLECRPPSARFRPRIATRNAGARHEARMHRHGSFLFKRSRASGEAQPANGGRIQDSHLRACLRDDATNRLAMTPLAIPVASALTRPFRGHWFLRQRSRTAGESPRTGRFLRKCLRKYLPSRACGCSSFALVAQHLDRTVPSSEPGNGPRIQAPGRRASRRRRSTRDASPVPSKASREGLGKARKAAIRLGGTCAAGYVRGSLHTKAH